jgi:hypothetical protein
MSWNMTDTWVREALDLYDNGKPFLFGVVITGLAWLAFNFNMLLERGMARRKLRKLHRQEMAEVADGVSYLLQAMVDAKKIRPITMKRVVRNMGKIGLKQLGNEPSFGIPKNALDWVDPRTSVNLLKVQIAERLPVGLFAKFLNRRVEKEKKATGMFSFMNEIRAKQT